MLSQHLDYLDDILVVCGHLQLGKFNKVQISHFTKPD